MKINELNGKKICIVGYAREGVSMHNALNTYAPGAKITIADRNEQIHAPDATLQLGKDYLKNLQDFDVIICSSGIPPQPEFDAIRHKMANMTRIFFDTIEGTGVETIGVTGSKGKSTTSNLIYRALEAVNDRTYLMGNIGQPMIDFIAEARPGTTFVIELSSYMLEHLQKSPHIAVITSFFPEHIDRHGSIDHYFDAKRNIAAHQSHDDIVLYNATYDECKKLAAASPGHKIPYTAADFPLPLSATKLVGGHNRANLAAAYQVARIMGVPDDLALDALKKTEGLPYRLHSLGKHHGIEWVEDSLATAPEATMFALEALGSDVDTLITGGMDRGYNFSGLGVYIAHSAISNIVLLPDTGAKIKQAIEAAKPITPKNYFETSDMRAAVAFAKKHTKKSATCLLSNASPSYNLFKNHEDKAKQFEDAIK